MTNLAAALDAFKPFLEADYETLVHRQFARMVADHGPTLRGVRNSQRFARLFGNLVGSYVKRDADGTYGIDGQRLLDGARAYADTAVAAWKDKIEAKLGTLENTRVERLDGIAFRIDGWRGSHAVQIVQQMILNVSSQGLPFNQFPARIYVNGKLTSAAAYKRLAA